MRGGIKTEIKSKLFLPLEIKIHADVSTQKEIANRIEQTALKISRLLDLKNQNALLLRSLTEQVFTTVYNDAAQSGKILDLMEFIKEKPRNGFSPKPVERETSCMSLTLSATTTGYFDDKCTKFIDEEIAPDSHLWLQDGDILIQRGNSVEYVGVSAVYRGEKNKFIYPDLMMKIIPKKDIIPEYLHIMLMSDQIRSYFRKNASGTSGSMPKINQGTVMNAPIPFVPVDQQKKIIEIAHNRLNLCGQLSAEITSGTGYSEALLGSVLSEVFMGIND